MVRSASRSIHKFSPRATKFSTSMLNLGVCYILYTAVYPCAHDGDGLIVAKFSGLRILVPTINS
eukprot:SAG31_NODE_43_length_31224_cov_10.112578_2_plen_64_part_00